MRIAILGATSQIAKDMILALATDPANELIMFARRVDAVVHWQRAVGLKSTHKAYEFSEFNAHQIFDAIINFVGSGNPALTASMGASIFEVTHNFDQLALDYVNRCPDCRYIFMSSGAAYCSSFEYPVDENTKATIPINDIQPTDWYGVAKLYAECRHRAMQDRVIFDIRIFNYFSHTSDLSSRFLIADILRAIQKKIVLKTSFDNIWRDFIGPDELYALIKLMLHSPPTNDVVDCFSKLPLDKLSLLECMQQNFGLRYELQSAPSGVNATGFKKNYFSLNRKAAIYGYKPERSALEIILHQVSHLEALQ